MTTAPCAACGFLTMQEASGSYAICGVCSWEDDSLQLANPTSPGGANDGSLADAQLEALAAHPLAVREVAGVRRDDWWRPLSRTELEGYARQVSVGRSFPNAAAEAGYWITAPLGFETVFTMTDFYDGPRAGIANHDGRPHHYESLWTDDDESWSAFALRPVGASTLQLALEDWYIWLRWEQAFYRGEATLQTHPALPADRERFAEISARLEEALPPHGDAVRATGEFSAPPGKGPRMWHGLAVRWTRLD